MGRIFVVVLVLIFFSCIVWSAIAGGGETNSCYKWSYNHLDGYVADSGDYWENIYSVKQTGRSYDGQQKDRQRDYNHYRLQINTRFVFSHKNIRDKILLADTL